MRQKSTFNNLWFIVIAIAVTMNFAFAGTSASQDSLILKKKNKTSYLKSGLPFTLPPLKPGTVSTTKLSVNRPDDKLLSNVQIYPNPVSDQINLRYDLSRNSNVTIKIVDMLGNDVATIFSQHVSSGDQKFTYIINNKLSRGFYFLRIIAGTESTIKRLSVL